MRPLVIDKSFAQSIGIERLIQLSRGYHFLIPTAFYYELFTTEDRKRRMTAQGFPEFQRVHLPRLLQQERETGKPMVSLDRKVMGINPAVAEEDFRLQSEEHIVLERHEKESVEPRVDFWIEVAKTGVPGFSNEELQSCSGTPDQFAAFCTTLRARYRVRRIAEEMGYPHASKLNERWIHFRHLQALALQGLVVLRKYGNPKNLISRENLEHDVQDLEYLTLGLHVGQLATLENSKKFERMPMKWRFEILEPRGQVITS
ncbi:MAG: hypothetical protein KDN20_02590 [Verrucomicrobiae bacterium]|nr:hypothetical protein [Verrucomicrobiae bacterium]